LVVTALLGLSVASSLGDHQLRAGGYLGLAALKPTLMPVLSVRLLVERRWRALAVAAAVTLGLVLLAAVVVSPKAVTDYPSYLLDLAHADSAAGVHVDQMINWRGAALRLGADDSLLATAGVIATMGLTVAAWWWARRSPRAVALGAAISLVATPLVIPHANQHEAILAMLGVLVAITAFEELRTRLAGAAIALQGLLWIGPALTEQAAAWLLFVALLTCLVALAALAWRERTRYFRPVPVHAGTV
jgi:arabinofuranan 3-O-arabinosyltransferase